MALYPMIILAEESLIYLKLGLHVGTHAGEFVHKPLYVQTMVGISTSYPESHV